MKISPKIIGVLISFAIMFGLSIFFPNDKIYVDQSIQFEVNISGESIICDITSSSPVYEVIIYVNTEYNGISGTQYKEILNRNQSFTYYLPEKYVSKISGGQSIEICVAYMTDTSLNPESRLRNEFGRIDVAEFIRKRRSYGQLIATHTIGGM